MAASEVKARQVWHITTVESIVYTMEFTDLLGSGETISAISGTNDGATLGVTSDAAVTVGTPSINAGAITYTDADGESRTIAIGKGVQVRLKAASGTVGTAYEISFVVATSDNNTRQQFATLQVV